MLSTDPATGRVLAVEVLFERAEPVDAPAVITGAVVDALQRFARSQAWDLWHANPSRAPFAVTETATIRGRAVALRLAFSRHGATVRRDWRVDGRPWRAADVLQAFGR